MKKQVDDFLHHPRTDLCLIGLILVSVALLVIEIGLDRDGRLFSRVHFIGEVITGIFAIELVLRFWTAPRKARFFRNYWADIIAILPLMRPFRFLRVVRLLRLHRVGLLVYRRLLTQSSISAAGFGIQLMVLLIIGIVIMVGGMAIHIIEGGENEQFRHLGDSLWWSFFSLVSMQPTLGEAKTELGKIVQAFIVVGGMATVAAFTGVMSAVMVQRLKQGLEVQDMDLEELRNHIVICGWNRAAHLVIEELHADPEYKNRPIVAVAEFDELPEHELKRIDRNRLFLQRGDYTSIDVLETVGIRHAAEAILLADKSRPRSDQDRDARTVLAALTIEKLNPKIFTCAQLLDRKNNVQLQVAGVENIVIDDEISGSLLATTTRNRGLIGVMTELFDAKIGNNLYKVSLPVRWCSMTFGDAARELKEKYDGLALGIERPTASGRHDTILNPPNSFALQARDELVVVARSKPQLSQD